MQRADYVAKILCVLRIHTIDCKYQQPQFAASYLIEDGERACFVENNTSHATPYLLDHLKQQSLTPENVDLIIVTHAHLDHAGGTAALLAHCPNAKVIAHPKAARTLIDPSRLLASAKKVYGEEAFKNLYGEILPVSADRVQSMEDNEVLKWRECEFQFLHTLGHATHHFCVHEKSTNSIFTGDAFGIRYPQVSKDFLFPSTSPIDFDPIEAKKSVARIAATNADRAYLTHFGVLYQLKIASVELTRHLDAHEEVLKKAIHSKLVGRELSDYCEGFIRSYFKEEIKRRNIADNSSTWDVLELDVTINAQGIAFVAERARAHS